MKRKIIYVLMSTVLLIIILYLVFNFFYNPFSNLTIYTENDGFYKVDFYDFENEKVISYGKKLSYNGKINIDNKKLNEDSEFSKRFLVIVQSKDQLGLGTYSIIRSQNEEDYEKEIYNLYKANYDNEKIRMKFIKKDSNSNYSLVIQSEIKDVRLDLKIHFNEALSFFIPIGGYGLNGFLDNGDNIGMFFVPKYLEQYSLWDSENNVNANIYSGFLYKDIVLENKTDRISVLLPVEQIGGVTFENDLKKDEYVKYNYNGVEIEVKVTLYLK